MTVTKTKITALRTVYPPISNADAVPLMRDPEVEALLRQSDFYMIGGRARASLTQPIIDAQTETMEFDFVVAEKSSSVRIVVRELPGVAEAGCPVLEIEFDAEGRGFRIWKSESDGDPVELLEWFTTEKLLWDRARGRPGIYGLDNLRDLGTYDLLYVGIAKEGDSFDRLLARGHKARQEILANEPQRLPGARVSDETFLFMFMADPLFIQTFEPDHEFTDGDFQTDYDGKRIVADAEKAFVSLLRPEYNVQLFKNYPKGADGLYGAGLARYGYVIAEQFAFNTVHGTIRGGVRPDGMISNGADAIFVEGDAVKLFRSGVDFPADDDQPATTD